MNDVDSVASKLAPLLRHPDDLDKIPSLKAELQRKKAGVDAQLQAGLKDQLEVTQTGMNSIHDASRILQQIKEEMQKVDKMCSEQQNMIKDFGQINAVAQAHRNFTAVLQLKNDIESFDARLTQLEMLLDEDSQNIEQQPNLLAIHMELTKLRDIRDTAMEQAKGSEKAMELMNNLQLSSGMTLSETFQRLDEVIDAFDEHLGTACMNIIPLVQQGNDSMVVRLALVISEEEKSDNKAKALQDAQKEYKDLASRFKSITAGPKETRGYKEKFLKAIEMYADNQMDESNDMFQDDPDKLEKSVRWFFNDLNTVKLGMQRLTPKKWKIFQTYVQIYHKQMHDWLVALIDNPQLTPPQMLAIVQWADKYYTKMEKLGVPRDMMKVPVIDNRSADLIREYRQLIVKAVEEWMDRMVVTDKKNFLSRDESSLDTDENGCLRTKTMGDMWRMLREQLDVAESSKRTDVAEGVVEAMFRSLISRQRMWEQLVSSELQKYLQPNADQEGLQPLQDFLVAIANDQIACIDDAEDEGGSPSYLTQFSRAINPIVSSAYSITVTSQTETLRDGYVDLSTHCLNTFAQVIFSIDFRNLMSEFFTPAWYSKKAIGQAVSTFEDYLNDYLPVLHPSLRDILVEELADELLIHYLSSVRNKSVKFRRSDPFVQKIRDDILTVFGYFEKFEAFEAIKQKWRVVDGFTRLLESDKAQLPDVYAQFKTDYWDVNMSWVEAVLRARDDFDRSLLNAVKARAGEIEVVRGPDTVMAKVK
ncbi:exocyst complex component Sec6 [Eremomyces bilateralis CBS 781.70]|uniref:Exocyst complex component Sec6 n=1 Tax=Eremomyces bilateralis CBS 781.70 TaxID=1392243 RepID=A0A6G1FZG0_9PEZI|nr:exocyst complex component Sec6 [Eremomyces bilateralis CBS 781.70]KAF1811237.1 exocyst complex component Sec6 [Eremomyces bilateralis CBS 781.70]